VIEQVEKGSKRGALSVSYKVRNDAGQEGFLKAFDLARAFSDQFLPKLAEEMLAAYNFELELLRECQGMSRVVRALADGTVPVPGSDIPVPYLIFELADCDVRHFLHVSERFDIAWKLRTLHQVAVGLAQLHTREIAHQDVKPSKVLMFGERESKLGDLARAAAGERPVPALHADQAGDPDYAPPEWLYSFELPNRRRRLEAHDMYRFGSLILFLFRDTDTTTAILCGLDRAHHPRIGGDTFEIALPHLQEAFDCACEELATGDDVPPELVQSFRELCQPDPRLRGSPAARAARHANPFSLERYISRFDLLASRAEHDLRDRRAA
jgi:serine/threonine protein kinase